MKQALSSVFLSWTLLTGMGAVTVLAAPPAIAQEATMNVLSVTGQGSERIATTRANVNLGVEVQGDTAAAVQQEAAQRSAAVVELLRDRGVENLQTTGIRLDPQYRYDNGEGQLVGYVATNTVSFEVPIADSGALLDDAVAAGATRIQGISFSAADEAIAAAREVALEKAVANARSQANAVLRTLDLTAEEIVGIQINGADRPMPIPLPRQAQLSAIENDAATPVVGGEQTVTATVTLQIRY